MLTFSNEKIYFEYCQGTTQFELFIRCLKFVLEIMNLYHTIQRTIRGSLHPTDPTIDAMSIRVHNYAIYVKQLLKQAINCSFQYQIGHFAIVVDEIMESLVSSYAHLPL